MFQMQTYGEISRVVTYLFKVVTYSKLLLFRIGHLFKVVTYSNKLLIQSGYLFKVITY